jgi:hypothetical protein
MVELHNKLNLQLLGTTKFAVLEVQPQVMFELVLSLAKSCWHSDLLKLQSKPFVKITASHHASAKVTSIQTCTKF